MGVKGEVQTRTSEEGDIACGPLADGKSTPRPLSSNATTNIPRSSRESSTGALAGLGDRLRAIVVATATLGLRTPENPCTPFLES